ncbi:MAG: hypothetical protein ABIK28_23730 [Planctomycetota bacterium]
MKADENISQILKGTEAAGKTYRFDKQHDLNLPAEMWFQESQEGLILFVVFYTQACRWSRCLGCNLPSRMSPKPVSYKAIMAQIDAVFADPEVRRQRSAIQKVIVSNNGSVLDEKTFSSTGLMYLLAMLNMHLPNLSVLSLETRPEFVDTAELDFLARALDEGETPTELELAVGFEAFDDHVRNDVFLKGLSLKTFEELAARVGPFGYKLKCYFMQKPVPDMTDAEAVADIRRAIDYLDEIGRAHSLQINMHLNPTYVASGTILEEKFRKGEFSPPYLRDVADAVRHARDKSLTVFIGLQDEGLSVEGGSFIRKGDEIVVEKLERFNRSQSFGILDEICGNNKME